MQSRFLKQLIYGIFYLVLVSGILYGGYAVFFRPAASCDDRRKNQGEETVDCGGPCIPCELKELQPIKVRHASVFMAREESVAVLIEFLNPNLRHGAERFSYDVDLFSGAGEKVGTFAKTTFIYPAEFKLVLDSVAGVSGAVRAEVGVRDPSWLSIQDFMAPEVRTREIGVTFDGSRGEAIVTGMVSNESLASLARIEAVVVVADASRVWIAAAKTILEDFSPGEERAFRVAVPGIALSEVSRSNVTVSVIGKR